MHIKYPTPRPRTKAAKIKFLKRSAASKSVHHQRRIRSHAKRNLAIALVLLIIALAFSLQFLLRTLSLLPPAGSDPQLDTYIRAAQASASQKRKGSQAPEQIGVASWYALGLRHPDALTCASTRFGRGTYLRVKDLRNGRQVTCLVNDYGPTPGTRRVIDLSRGSYSQLEGVGSGTMPVEIRRVDGPQ
ncbi:MAG TPA: septal ring lytic transglycosylase RlpA family protein [Candidatus Polarisedimenticolaceae bacterium]|nr:septal ring lytic transglycosylase RlpA family protein [Candidatus Polarisedimenticolaceae bacterium]